MQTPTQPAPVEQRNNQPISGTVPPHATPSGDGGGDGTVRGPANQFESMQDAPFWQRMVVVGGMAVTLLLDRYLMPVLYSFYGHRQPPARAVNLAH